eukprot:jgi/Picre1/30663/NNA_006024.t1
MAEAVKKLSPEIKDLLNRIFVIDAAKRVTIKQIERHPWYKMPLPEKYDAIIKKLEESHKKLDVYYQKRKDHEKEFTERAKKIEELVERSTSLPEPGDEEIVTIDLREDALLSETAAA